MKKQIILALLSMTLMVSLVSGCKKKEAEVPEIKEPVKVEETKKEVVEETKTYEFKNGAYVREYVEEYADGPVECKQYLYLADDGSGFEIGQGGDIPITWTKDYITDCNNEKRPYAMTGEGVLELDNGDFKEEYNYLADKLPDDVIKEMSYFLDGTKKVNDLDAAFAFDDLITSDTISFYSLRSTVDYAAEGADLDEMEAAYMEMTEDNLPVLFVKTPNAPKEVGYEHALQYSDGKIYNIIGLDKIEAVYKDAAVIVASINDENGDTTYYYMPDSNKELYVFASKNKANDDTSVCILYEETGEGREVTQEELDEKLTEAIAGTEAIQEIEWCGLKNTIHF